MAETHDARIARMTRQFDEAMARFLARLEAAGDAAEKPRPDGWNAAQIAWHVAKVNTAFAGLITGSIQGVRPAPAGFAERAWADVVAGVPGQLEARGPSRPPEEPELNEVLGQLKASAEAMRSALSSLTSERGLGYTLTTDITGEISVYQIGDWATAHVIRHNAQAKRVLGA